MALLQRLCEQLPRQEVDVLGDHAEHHTIEELCDAVWLVSSLPESKGDLCDRVRRHAGDLSRRSAGPELIRFEENGSKECEILGLCQIDQVEMVRLDEHPCEVSADDDRTRVADEIYEARLESWWPLHLCANLVGFIPERRRLSLGGSQDGPAGATEQATKPGT